MPDHRVDRRYLLRLALATSASAGATTALSDLALAASGRLAVFVHTGIRPRSLQKALGAALPGVEVIAYGLFKDFQRALHSSPDAVLALRPVLQHQGLAPQLQGTRGGSAAEPYALIGIGSAPVPAAVKSVGAVDLLGRRSMKSFVSDLVGASPKVKPVTKSEDLLPLLQFRAADAALLPDRLVPSFKRRSEMDLQSTRLSKRVGLPAAAAQSGAGNSIIAALRSLDAGLQRRLGVDGWR